MSMSATIHVVPEAPREDDGSSEGKRDWVAWYEDLDEAERRAIRDRIVYADYDEIRNDPELRTFFLFHVDDLADDGCPGTRSIRELWTITQTLRGQPERADERRKVVARLLETYRAHLLDNPWTP